MMPSIKEDYRRACSAFRYEVTYSPDYDYFYHHYPCFDESRCVDDELRGVSNLALGAAYRSIHLERWAIDRYSELGRYLTRQNRKRADAKRVVTYHYKVVAREYADGHIEESE